MEKMNTLMKMKTYIESMEKTNQIEVLRIFHSCNVSINENKNGIYINLSDIPNETIEEVNSFLQYVKSQENILLSEQEHREKFKNEYFTLENDERN